VQPEQQTEDLLRMTESWFSSLSSQPLELFRSISTQPFPDLHCGALRVFTVSFFLLLKIRSWIVLPYSLMFFSGSHKWYCFIWSPEAVRNNVFFSVPHLCSPFKKCSKWVMSAVLFLETLIQRFFFPLKSFTVGHCFDNSLKMLEKHWTALGFQW